VRKSGQIFLGAAHRRSFNVGREGVEEKNRREKPSPQHEKREAEKNSRRKRGGEENLFIDYLAGRRFQEKKGE